MSKTSSKQTPITYKIVQVDHFDGSTTFEIRRDLETLMSYPAEALPHAIEALKRIEQFQGIKKESELFKYTYTPGETKPEDEES
jgi:hypothetical protein